MNYFADLDDGFYAFFIIAVHTKCIGRQLQRVTANRCYSALTANLFYLREHFFRVYELHLVLSEPAVYLRRRNNGRQKPQTRVRYQGLWLLRGAGRILVSPEALNEVVDDMPRLPA